MRRYFRVSSKPGAYAIYLPDAICSKLYSYNMLSLTH